MEFWQQQFYIDTVSKGLLDNIASPVIDVLMKNITNLASPRAFYIMAAAAFIYFVFKRKMTSGLFLVASLFAAWAIMNWSKLLFMRERPAGEQLTNAAGYSFPSGHATLSLVFYGFFIYLLLDQSRSNWSKIIAGGLILLILFIGVSRVYLNVHFATDVLGGFALGGILLTFFILTFRFIVPRS